MWNALTSHAALTIFGLLLLIAAFPIVGLLLWHTMQPSDFDERKEVVVLLAQGFAIIVGASALFFTWRRIQISQEGQITERFTRAIQQLGDTKLEVRLGGIYALERIARDSPRDHWTIMEVLTAYVRENAPWKDSPPPAQPAAGPAPTPSAPAIRPRTDIQAILTVLSRRPEKASKEERKNHLILDLHGTDLRGADLMNAHMEEAILTSAHLEWADIRAAHMEGAFLMNAHMEGANLRGATGLTRGQLASATTDRDTILPDYLKEQGIAPSSP
ncbi:MAG: pentapeptide repeat-containing protein [Chloroflexota bacterium]